MAPHSGKGMSALMAPASAAVERPRLIMPTWGPLPWAMTTSLPSAIRSTIALAVLLTRASCSVAVLPRALPPRAITIRLLIIQYTSFLRADRGVRPHAFYGRADAHIDPCGMRADRMPCPIRSLFLSAIAGAFGSTPAIGWFRSISAACDGCRQRPDPSGPSRDPSPGT